MRPAAANEEKKKLSKKFSKFLKIYFSTAAIGLVVMFLVMFARSHPDFIKVLFGFIIPVCVVVFVVRFIIKKIFTKKPSWTANPNWKADISSAFGNEDLVFALHPLDEQRAIEMIQGAFGSGSSTRDIVMGIEEFLDRKDVSDEHKENQIRRALNVIGKIKPGLKLLTLLGVGLSIAAILIISGLGMSGFGSPSGMETNFWGFVVFALGGLTIVGVLGMAFSTRCKRCGFYELDNKDKVIGSEDAVFEESVKREMQHNDRHGNKTGSSTWTENVEVVKSRDIIKKERCCKYCGFYDSKITKGEYK